MRRDSAVGFGVWVFWLLQTVAGCGARSGMLIGFAGEGGTQSGPAGTFGEGGKGTITAGGTAGAGAGNGTRAGAGGGSGSGGRAAAGGTHSASGGEQTVQAGRQEASSGFGGELAGGSAGSAGQAGGAGGASICDREVRFSANLDQCAQGFVHRARALTCPLPARDPDAALGASGSAPIVSCPSRVRTCNRDEECQSDEDCDFGEYCIALHIFSFDMLELGNVCMLPCRDDTECYATELCACKPFTRASTLERIELGTCRYAACRVDADCGPDGLCGAPLEPVPLAPDMPPTFSTFTCTTPRDECRGNEDCPPPADTSCCAENLCSRAGLDHLACIRREHCDACN